MTRIIAGRAGGRRLLVPPGSDTRPTSDRVREALFSRLEHEGWLADTRVLDLYAGSGALGLEAVSRGARAAVLVEHARAATAVIRRNIATSGLAEVTLLAERVERALERPPDEPFDLVLADPPYSLDEPGLAQVLARLVEQTWLAERAALVVERTTRSSEPAWPNGVAVTGERAYGQTRLWFAQRG